MKLPNLLLFLFLVHIIALSPASAAVTYQDLVVDRSVEPTDNPLKGFMPYADQNKQFPHSLEWFYLPMKALMNGPDAFTLEVLEDKLADIQSRGHQAVFRIYLDYPSLETGVPDYLVNAGVAMQQYSEYGGGLSPDYTDERLLAAMEQLIAELGRQYNGDPRIGFITVGFLGHWGEWHTYPHEDWFPGQKIQTRVLTAMKEAFPDIHLLLRYPGHHIDGLATGYHDDSFAYATLPTIDWHFLQIMEDAQESEAWKTNPIGGEIYPDIQETLFNTSPPDEAEDYATCVNQTHASWLLNYSPFEEYNSWSSDKQARVRKAARMLGYSLAVSRVGINQENQQLTVYCSFINQGVAPFYYDWPVKLVVRNTAGSAMKQLSTDWQLTAIQPGVAPQELAATLSLTNLEAGEYQVGIRVDNPMDGGKALFFANKEQQEDGLLLLDTITIQAKGQDT